jgi:diadenosine tetraphosphate (Ap4A) HIT family hydrolase
MPNQTIEKFGYPATLIREFEHWMVLVRPAQVTLGSLVLANKSDATAYGALAVEAFAEQGKVVTSIEEALSHFCGYERLNYLMLMMVDPNVHFHVIPRYSKPKRWQGISFPDAGWPGPPDLKSAITLNGPQLSQMVTTLQASI